METAECSICGTRAIVKRDGDNNPISQMCVHGHPFKFDPATIKKPKKYDRPTGSGPQVARGRSD